MLNVLESIRLSTEYLDKKGIPSSRLNAELLLAEILECKRLDLYMAYERPLTEPETNRYREYIQRRSKGEPLQYIIGHVDFYGITIDVDNNVLIPRQETEILVETVIKNCTGKGAIRILDIGTGSGNIVISLAKNLPEAKFTAIDKSREVLKRAYANIKKHHLEDRIKLIHTDVFENKIVEDGNEFDVIVSNPPYVPSEKFDTLQTEITGFEPKSAVTDFANGYSFYERISEISPNLLAGGGEVYYELGEGQATDVEGIMKRKGFKNIIKVKDYLDIERVIYGEL